MHKLSLGKRQRLCSQTAIDKLFSPEERKKGENNYLLVYPWRTIWRIDREANNTFNKILISVPKKKIRKATNRVKIRRRCREAYRTQRNNYLFTHPLNIAFIYIADNITNYKLIHYSISEILEKIKSKLNKENINEIN